MSAPASITASPTTCAGCVFGAVSSLSITPQYHTVEIITVDVTPYVSVFANGSSSTYSLESHTRTTTGFVGGNSTGATGTYAGPTFDNIDDITWTIGDKTLTYGTTYYQYLGFEGAVAPISGPQACVEATDVTEIRLPQSTEEASFIYPYTAGAGLPAELLEYLETIPTISAQLTGEDLVACAPLTASTPPSTFTHATLSHGSPLGAPPEESQNTPAYSTANPSAPVNDHTTAYVISRLTNPPIRRTESADSPPTPGSNTTPEPVLDPSAGNTRPNSPPPQTTGGGGGGSSPGLGGLSSAIISAIENTASPGSGQNGPAQETGAAPVFNVGDTTVSTNSNGQYQFGTQVLTPGETITAGRGPSATEVVLQTEGGSTELVVDGTTFQGTDGPTAPPIVTAGGQTYTAVGTSGAIILAGGSSTITIPPGLQTIVDGQTISAGSGGSTVVINGQIYNVSPASATSTEMVITVNDHTITATDRDGSVILQDATSTITLDDGSRTTFASETISALQSGNGLVIDGSITTTFGPASTSFGDYIQSGMNPSSTTETGTEPTSDGTAPPADNSAATSVTAITTLLVGICLSTLLIIM